MPGVRLRESASMNVLMHEFYANAEGGDALESLRVPVRKVLETQRDRCKRKAELLQQELAVSEEASRYRLQAELLLAFQHEVKRGQSSVVLPNIFEGKDNPPEVTVPLDPRFHTLANANRPFPNYHNF